MAEETAIADAPQQVDVPQGPGDPQPQLPEQHRAKLDSIVQQMIKNKESDSDIRAVVDDFKIKYSVKAPAEKPPQEEKLPAPARAEVTPWSFKTVDLPAYNSDDAQQKIKEATDKINKAFHEKADDVVKDDLVEQMDRKAADAHMSLGIDNTAVAKNIPSFLVKKEKEDQRNSIPQDLVEQIKNDPASSRHLMNKAAIKYKVEGKPQEAHDLQAAAYTIDSHERLTPENSSKIQENLDKIKSGDYTYNIDKQELYKKVGNIDAAIHGYQQRTKDYQGGLDLAGMNKEERTKYADNEIKNSYDPDNAIPVPHTLSEMVGSEGLATTKSLLAGALTQTFTANPELAGLAAAGASSDEYAARAYKNEYIRTYGQMVNELKKQHPELPESEIKNQADELAVKNARIAATKDVAVGGLMTISGARLGGKALSFEFSPSVVKTAANALKGTGNFLREAAPEALSNAAIVGGSQYAANAASNAIGVKRDNTEGVADAATMGAAFPIVFGGVIHLAKGAAKIGSGAGKKLLQSLSKQPPELVAKGAADMVQDGAITPEEAQKGLQAVAEHKAIDLQIPDHVTDEKTRLDIHDKIEQYNANKAKLGKPEEGGIHESLQKPIKEQQKDIEWDVNMLSETPENQKKLLTSKRNELQSEIDAHDEAKKEDGVGKLDDRAAVKKRLSYVAGKLEEVQSKLDSPVYQATKVLEEHGDKLPSDIERGMAKSNPEEYLKYIAEQAHGGRENDMLEQGYPAKIIGAAKEAFPKAKEETSSSVSVIKPEDNRAPNVVTVKPEENIAPSNTEFTHEQENLGVAKEEPIANSEQSPIAENVEAGQQGERSNDTSPEKIAITHAGMDKVSRELGLPEYEKSPESLKEWQEQADARIAKNPNEIWDVVNKMRDGHIPDAVETYMVKRYVSDLKAKYAATKSDAILTEIKRIKDISNIAGREWGKAGRARQGELPVEETLDDFMIRNMDETGVSKLTDKQKADNEKEFDDIAKADAALKERVAKLEAENAKLKAEKAIKKEHTSVGKKATKKTKEDFTKERKDIVESIREKLRKARNETSVVAVPYAKELIAIAPDVARLAKSLVEEGIIKLEDVVKNIHAQLTEDFPNIQEKDIHNIIAGEYTEKKTKNQISEKLENLRIEAKLANQLEAKMRGEPKSEPAKIKRNKEIDELREKIKSYEKELSEASKFYPDTKTAEQKALQSIKTRTANAIKELNEQLATGKFEETKPEPVKRDAEAIKLNDELTDLRLKRDARLLQEKYATMTKTEKAGKAVVEVLNSPRTIMSSMDLSAAGRQGLVASIAHPKLAAGAFKAQLSAAASEKFFNRWFHEVKHSPDYKIMQDSKLALNDPLDPRLQAREEAFMSHLPEKIPVVGSLIKGSERAYVLYLNKLRVDIFRDGVAAFEANGKTFENHPELYKALANHINNMTGRGEISGKLENAAPILNSIFFSPRLIASRINLLTNWANPKFYKSVPPEIRKMYFKDMAKFTLFGASLLGAANLIPGVSVEKDPRSSDFLKIKTGDTRFDVIGGFGQYIRTLGQMGMGQKMTSSGKVYDLDGKQQHGTRISPIVSFWRGKLAPVPGLAVDFVSGSDVVGNKILWQWGGAGDREIDLKDITQKTFLPLVTGDFLAAYKKPDAATIAAIIASTVGVGTQTYVTKGGGSGGGAGATGRTEKRTPRKPVDRSRARD